MSANDQWAACSGCGSLVYQPRLRRNLQVCPDCAYHHRLSAAERIAQLVDESTFQSLTVKVPDDDALHFVDSRPYGERLAVARQRTGQDDAAVVGTAVLGGSPCILGVMNFGFLGGSMGCAVGEAVCTAAEEALRRSLPLILVTASGGARMQEGVFALLQMARTAQAMTQVREAGLLSVCVLTDPTFGGVTASFASLGDILIAETGALIGFAGPRVITQTVQADLPVGFQRAQSLLEHGLVDRVENRDQIRPVLARILKLHHSLDSSEVPGEVSGRRSRNTPRRVGAQEHVELQGAWGVVQRARDSGRPTTREYLAEAFDDFLELRGDRAFGDDPAVVGGVARLGERAVVVVGHQKGHSTGDLVQSNFGMPHPEGYRKALRLFRHAERLGLPVVTLVDTPGAYPGVQAEERGQSAAVAEIISASSRLTVPLVSVVTGEGGSGGALALATGDRLLVLENAFFSVISPEGCASILWRTAQAAPEAAAALRLTAGDLYELGVADEIVPEPPGGAQQDPDAMYERLHAAIARVLEEVCAWDQGELTQRRRERIRRFGQPSILAQPQVESEPKHVTQAAVEGVSA